MQIKKVYKIVCSLEHNLVMHMSRDIVANIDYELQLDSMEIKIMCFLNTKTLDISLFPLFIR